jgi:predicted Zn-dependent protease
VVTCSNDPKRPSSWSPAGRSSHPLRSGRSGVVLLCTARAASSVPTGGVNRSASSARRARLRGTREYKRPEQADEARPSDAEPERARAVVYDDATATLPSKETPTRRARQHTRVLGYACQDARRMRTRGRHRDAAPAPVPKPPTDPPPRDRMGGNGDAAPAPSS